MSYHATGAGRILIHNSQAEEAYYAIHNAWMANFPTFQDVFSNAGFEVGQEEEYVVMYGSLL